MKGAFDEPIDFAQRVFLTGVEIKQSAKSSLLLSFRRSTFGGLPTAPLAGVSPDFAASLLTLEQRFAL